ncbi:MAG TPA: DHHA1 domain-containing protein [Vicinamibacterales bacterium]|nr:DHHA1 domain-containing protein [Vicinamibacterales bacterium]
MSSERLYYTDPYLVEFDAVVREVSRQEDRWKIVLDRTAFYPTSGGQPFDTGTIGEAMVLDVFDQEDGTVGHLIDREIETNSRVRGHVDWSRRFDHMQQHTGQHLLSAAFEREAGARTLSFHLGTTASTIDLDKELPADQIARVEDIVNKVLWEDREVCVKFVTASEAAKLPLRKEPAREGELRIIDIKDYDLSACGGTHVRRTGGIGVIAISGVERFKGGLRVEFVCGGRALRVFRSLKNAVGGSVRLLSVLPDDLPSAIEKLQLAGRTQQKSQEGLYERLAAHEAASLAVSGEKIGATNVVAAAVTGWDVNGLKKLASSIASKPATIAVLITTELPAVVVVARSQDLALDTGAVLKTLIDRFGGRGGGKGAMAQGGGLAGDSRAILDAARAAITSLGT